MTALTKARTTPRRDPGSHHDPVAAGVVIHSGALLVLNATHYAEPATQATGLRVRGVAEHSSNNATGGNGAGDITSRTGAFRFHNAGDIDRANIGDTAYITDDQTVQADATGSSAVGRIDDVDTSGVWVVIE